MGCVLMGIITHTGIVTVKQASQQKTNTLTSLTGSGQIGDVCRGGKQWWVPAAVKGA